MKLTYATYEHHCIGFPGVVLKWHEEGLLTHAPYIVVKGTIFGKAWRFANHDQPNHRLDREFECAKFDAWVREKYCDDVSVQG